MANNPLTPKVIANHSYEIVRFDYQGSFDKFSIRGDDFYSEYFAPPGRKTPVFSLRFYLSYKTEFSVSLVLKSSMRVVCKTSCWLLTKESDKLEKQDKSFALNVGNHNSARIFTSEKLNVKDEKNGLLPKDTLTICCELTLELETFSGKVSSSCPIQMLDRAKTAFDDLGKLLQSGEYSDFEFIIGQRKFPVHKAILHSRSPYFKALFSQQFQEKTTNSAPIEDIDADLFAGLLDYIYTSNLPKFTDKTNATEMMIIADRFQLEQLKTVCEYELGAHITTDCMFNMLLLADTYNASVLKTKSMEFISSSASSMDILKALFEKEQFFCKQSAAMMNVVGDLLKDK